MTQHFVETNCQPHLIVLTRQFDCLEDNLQTSFDKILLNLEQNFTEQQNSYWEKYWTKQGETLILEKWKASYGDYLADATETTNNVCLLEEKAEESNEEDSREIEETKSLERQAEQDLSWQDLWQQHSEEIYYEQFVLFSSIFYNFYLDLKTKLQSEIEVAEEADSPTNQEQLEVGINSDNRNERDSAEGESNLNIELLQLLGLPTEFGRRQGGTRSETSCKRVADNCAHYNDYFFHEDDVYSDNEDNDKNDIDDDDDESHSEFINDLPSLEMSASNQDNQDNDEASLHELQTSAIVKAKNRKKNPKNRKLRNLPAVISEDKTMMLKYWHKRFSLFSRFDEGIRLDRESWFSVTPEKVARHLAERLACDLIIDGFCGCGGNAIQFAQTCRRVIAIDIDPLKIEMARHNAEVYGVADKIEFIVGDFFHLTQRLRADTVFLSPPWGGPKYKNKKEFDIEEFLLPVGATPLVASARNISENIALFLPRNSNMQQIVRLAGVGKRCEVEHNYLDTRLVAITALYGEDILEKKEGAEAVVE